MSDTAESTPPPSPPPPPPTTIHEKFDFTDSDVSLLSSDAVLFRVHRANLAAFSAVFKNTFTDGQAQSDSEPVSVSEMSGTLEILLAMCYPSEDPPVDFTTLEAKVILACYEAAVKYQMWVAGLALRSFVQPLVNLEPFLVVKLAYRLNDSVLMTAAADEALNCDILANAREYAEKAGPDVWPRLLEFHYRRRMEVVDFLSALEEPQQSYCNSCGRSTRGTPAGKEAIRAMLLSKKARLDSELLQAYNLDAGFCLACPNRKWLQNSLGNFSPQSCF